MYLVAALHKAMSICGSHILAVMLFGFIVHMYLKPFSSYDLEEDHQVFYTVVISMLNPLIYSLRNQEVIGALQRLFRKMHLRNLPA